MKKLKTSLFKLSLLTTTMTLIACGGNAPKESLATADKKSGTETKTLIYCSEASPETFDPAQSTAGTVFDASSYAVYNGIVQFKSGDTSIEPALAEKWDISEDGKTYTFHLRQGVKFGTTDFFTPTRNFNADDIIFTLKRLTQKDFDFNKAYPAEFPYSEAMELPDIIKTIKKVDDYTVKVELNEVNAPFLQNLAMPFAYIGSAEYANKLINEGKPEQYALQPVGTGPFIFKKYQKDAQIRYSKNIDYWDKDNVHLDNLVFVITKDSAVRAQKVQVGECNVSGFPKPAEVKAVKKSKKANIAEKPGFNVAYIAYNTEKEKLKDVKVRQALDMAINKEAIINAVYQSLGVKATNPMPPTQWSYNKDLRDAPYDIEKAKKLLKEGGVENLSLDLWYMPVQRPYNSNAKLMAEMVQADWNKIGVKANLKTFEWGEYLKRGRKGEHDVIMNGWIGDNGDPDNWLGVLLSCASIDNSNYARWCNPDFDKLIIDARQINDQAERTKKYEHAQVIFKDQLPWTTIGHSMTTVFTTPNVKGYKISPFGAVRFDGVSIEK